MLAHRRAKPFEHFRPITCLVSIRLVSLAFRSPRVLRWPMRRAQRLLLSLLALFAVMGVLHARVPEARQPFGEFAVGESILVAALLFAWCKADAAERGISPPKGAPVLVALFAPVGVPYYILRTRPWRAAAVSILRAFLFFLALGVVYEVTRTITFIMSKAIG